MVSDEKSFVRLIEHFFNGMSCFCLAALEIHSFSWAFNRYPGLNLFQFILLEICWSFRCVDLCFSSSLITFVYHSSNILYVPFSFFSWNSCYAYVGVLGVVTQVSEVLTLFLFLKMFLIYWILFIRLFILRERER